jgi:hypothetical protein
MTAPTTRATPKIALDQRAASRHDKAIRNDGVCRLNPEMARMVVAVMAM